MIPDFDNNGNLPPGIHTATIKEVAARFATNSHRGKLFNLLLEVLMILQRCNCPEVHLNGSYITTKEEPEDYDLCFESTGIEPTPELYDFLAQKEEARKKRYGGDIFVRMPEPPYYYDHVTQWQTDGRNDDLAKGILRINLQNRGTDS